MSEDYKIIYKPCKKCGSDDYDNCDTSDECIDEDIATGSIILEPKSCDHCNLYWLESPSPELH